MAKYPLKDWKKTGYPNYIGAGGAPEWERDVWMSLKTKLESQADKVQKADNERVVQSPHSEFKYFDPSRFECSVSII